MIENIILPFGMTCNSENIMIYYNMVTYESINLTNGDTMKKQLFGNSIVPSCVYCEHSVMEGNAQICTVHKTLKNGKCRKFVYNPIMRVPRGAAKLPTYKNDDFSI